LRETLGRAAADHGGGLQVVLLEADLLGHQPLVPAHGLDGDGQAVEQLIGRRFGAAEAQEAAATAHLRAGAHVHQRLRAVACGNLQPVVVACGNDTFDFRPFRHAGQIGGTVP
jgi:hypothetical protein